VVRPAICATGKLNKSESRRLDITSMALLSPAKMCKVPCTVILIFFLGLHYAGGYTTVERVSGQCPTILSSGECQSLAPYHGLPWNGIGLIGPRGCFRSDVWGFTGLYYRGGSDDCSTTRKCICKVTPAPTRAPTKSPTATPTVSSQKMAKPQTQSQ